MGIRNIGGKLTLEGVNEFAQGAKKINASLKEMKSAARLVDSEFRETANTTEALTKKGKVLTDQQGVQAQKVKNAAGAYKQATSEAERLEKAVGGLTDELADKRAELKKLESSSGDTTEAQEQLILIPN